MCVISVGVTLDLLEFKYVNYIVLQSETYPH